MTRIPNICCIYFNDGSCLCKKIEEKNCLETLFYIKINCKYKIPFEKPEPPPPPPPPPKRK